MISMKHPHILRYHEFFIDTDNELNSSLVLIMVQAELNLPICLSDIITPLPQEIVINIIRQISLGIKHLHLQVGIALIDLKPKNILLMLNNIFAKTEES